MEGVKTMVYPKNTVYIIGNAQSQQKNPITHIYNMFFIGLVVDRETGYIVDAGASGTIPITSEFIKSIFVGKNIEKDGDEIASEVETRYFGSSQKAIMVAFKDAQKKYFQIKKGDKVDI